MTNNCPFCNADMSNDAKIACEQRIKLLSEGKNVKTCLILCNECGEPVSDDGDGLRKPTPFEYENVINSPPLKFGRARWQCMKNYKFPLAEGWKSMKEQLVGAAKAIGKDIGEAQLAVMEGIYWYGAMIASQSINKVINDDALDDLYTSATISLICDEITSEIESKGMNEPTVQVIRL